MKAVVKIEPKPGARTCELPEPRIGSNDVLVEVKAAGICGSDIHMNEWVGQGYDWMTLPIVMGHECSGRVAEVGENVRDVQVDDRVAITPHIYCGKCYFCKTGQFNLCLKRALKIGFTRDGCFSEYIAVPGECIYKLPPEVSYELGAILEPLCVALHGTEVAHPESGDTVAILGAGPIALLSLQVTKIAGAGTVLMTGLQKDEERLAVARALGADATVNVEKDDPVDLARKMTNDLGVDIVYELSGSPNAFKQGVKMLRRGGRMVAIGLSMGTGEIAPISDMVRAETRLYGSFNYVPSTWMRALKLLERRMIDPSPLVTHRLPLERAEEGFRLAGVGKAIKVLLIP